MEHWVKGFCLLVPVYELDIIVTETDLPLYFSEGKIK